MRAWQERARERVEDLLSGGSERGFDPASQEWVDRFYRGSETGAADRARADVEQILHSEAFVDANRNWFSALLDAYFEWRDKGGAERTSSGGSSAWDPSQFLLVLIIAVVVVLIVVFIVQQFKDRRSDVARSGTIAERIASRVEEFRSRARAAEAAGDWIEALRLDFFALVIGLGERGDLDYRDAWTNRELLERGMPGKQVELALRPVVGRLDAHSFGHLPSGREEVVEFRAFCDRLLEGRA